MQLGWGGAYNPTYHYHYSKSPPCAVGVDNKGATTPQPQQKVARHLAAAPKIGAQSSRGTRQGPRVRARWIIGVEPSEWESGGHERHLNHPSPAAPAFH